MARKIKRNVKWKEKTTIDRLPFNRSFDTFTEEDTLHLIKKYKLNEITPEKLCFELNNVVLPAFLDEKFNSDYLPNITDKKELLKKLQSDVETLLETLITFKRYDSAAFRLFHGFSQIDIDIMLSEALKHVALGLPKLLYTSTANVSIRQTEGQRNHSVTIEPNINKDNNQNGKQQKNAEKSHYEIILDRFEILEKNLYALRNYTSLALLRLNHNKYKETISSKIQAIDKELEKRNDLRKRATDINDKSRVEEEIKFLDNKKLAFQEYLKKVPSFKSRGNTSKEPVYLFAKILKHLYESYSGKKATVIYNEHSADINKYSSWFLDFLLYCVDVIQQKSSSNNLEGYIGSIFPKTRNAWIAIIKKNNAKNKS